MVLILFKQLVVMLLLVACGFALQKAKPLSDHGISEVSRVCMAIFAPSLLLSCVVSCDPSSISLKLTLAALAAAGGMHLAMILLGNLYARFVTKNPEERANYVLMMSFSNVGFFGIPLVSAAYGPDKTIYAAFFILFFQVLTYTYGLFLLEKVKFGRGRFSIFNLTNTGVYAAVLSIAYFLINRATGWVAPEIPLKFINYLGGAVTPLALVLVGISVARLSFKKVFTDWRMLLFMVIRMIAVPIAAALVLRPILRDPVLYGVAVLMFCMPNANSNVMLAGQYEINTDLVAGGILITTVVTIVTVPILMGVFA